MNDTMQKKKKKDVVVDPADIPHLEIETPCQWAMQVHIDVIYWEIMGKNTSEELSNDRDRKINPVHVDYILKQENQWKEDPYQNWTPVKWMLSILIISSLPKIWSENLGILAVNIKN